MVIKESHNTPYLELNCENSTLTIVGKSYPEHPEEFYDPVTKEINKCKDFLKAKPIKIKLAIEILNSVSTKYLFQLIKNIYESSNMVSVMWYYEDDDESMLGEGEYFKYHFPQSKFELIGVEDLRKYDSIDLS